METLEYRTIDKSAWERGPWDDEPDKIQFADDSTGFPCLIVRNRHGALCGYVGVPSGHPWHGKGYDDCLLHPVPEGGGYDETAYPDVHGGLTFAGPCGHGDDESTGICHKPTPGASDDVWWLGFDCAHAWDYTGMKDAPEWRARFPRDPEDVYRDVDYVKSEVRKLASQAASVA